MERFGLDFGTTNSALARSVDRSSAELLPLDLSASRPEVLRSLLYYAVERRGFAVGQAAIDEYLQEDMEGTLIQSLKSFLGSTTFEDTLIVDRRYRLEDLLAVLFRGVREAVLRRVGSLEGVEVVVGRPAVYVDAPVREDLARERVRRGAALAGLPRVRFQYEPIAAGLAYEAELTHPELALIADLGGGTSDFTVMRLGTGLRGDRRQDILATRGVQIGGDTFDARLVLKKLGRHFGRDSTYRSFEGRDLPFPAHLLVSLGHWHEIPFLRTPRTRELLQRLRVTGSDPEAVARFQELLDGNYAFFLFEEIERLKAALSVGDEAVLRFAMGRIAIEERVTRVELESMIAPDLDRVWEVLRDVLVQANLKPDRVDAVFVTGGSAQLPCVQARLVDMFGAERIRSGDFLTTVATGLAMDETASD